MIRYIWNLMMKWGWDFNRQLRDRDISCTPIGVSERSADPSIRIGIIPAMNGRALEIGKKIPDKHGGYDWQYSMFLVPEDVPLNEAMTTFLLLEGLK